MNILIQKKIKTKKKLTFERKNILKQREDRPFKINENILKQSEDDQFKATKAI